MQGDASAAIKGVDICVFTLWQGEAVAIEVCFLCSVTCTQRRSYKSVHCALCILSKGSTLHTKGKLKRFGIQYAHKEKQPRQTESFLKTLPENLCTVGAAFNSRLGSKTKKLWFTFDALYRVVAWI